MRSESLHRDLDIVQVVPDARTQLGGGVSGGDDRPRKAASIVPRVANVEQLFWLNLEATRSPDLPGEEIAEGLVSAARAAGLRPRHVGPVAYRIKESCACNVPKVVGCTLTREVVWVGLIHRVGCDMSWGKIARIVITWHCWWYIVPVRMSHRSSCLECLWYVRRQLCRQPWQTGILGDAWVAMAAAGVSEQTHAEGLRKQVQLHRNYHP